MLCELIPQSDRVTLPTAMKSGLKDRKRRLCLQSLTGYTPYRDEKRTERNVSDALANESK